MNVRICWSLLWIGVALLSAPPSAEAAERVTILKTPSGVRFGLEGSKPAKPAPTLFILGSSIEDTMGNEVYNKVGRILVEHGWISVGLDLPCHGQETRPGEPGGIAGWAARLKQGENVMASLSARCKDLLDYLIKEGYTDPGQVAIAGTSRGGFSALHVAAAEPRMRCIAGLAPVVELPLVSEFAELKQHELTRSLDLVNFAEALAGRPIWICIGNHDERVGTDACIAFTRRVTAESVRLGKPTDVELHVMTSRGHTTHPTAHDEIADWMLKLFETGAGNAK